MNARCEHCEAVFHIKPHRAGTARYCSRRCKHDAMQPGWLLDAVVMHCFYRFGAKRIAKIVGVTASGVLWGLKRSGAFDPCESPEPPRRPKTFDVELMVMKGYERERRSLARFDDGRHWVKHPVVNAWEVGQWQRRSHYSRLRYVFNRDNKTNYFIASRIRTRVYSVLKGIKKSAPTLELLGCSLDELRAHLERQFKPGMSWGNYGQWHVDHIKPCSAFDLEIEREQRQCFHHSNLQPLWGHDNWSKGGTNRRAYRS